ncbi:hypothetical protein [Reyranella sp.]|jgi:hypothetical protein|uniref:hypothetical protein n=1 Tax=Reyranella sp. TaxID=1929291 RepID=UPI002626F975|nr:hypothetical protein [Reyranella sp.]HQS15947.1 hypothetical protein [Reyranella sp.]HQT13213.1 hypothetical protein [Reyranella sp.]
MSMTETRPMPPASQLIRQGFQHWRVHQRAFWLLAGLGAIGIVVLKMVIPSGSSGVVAGLYIFVFDQWLKLALFPDWKQREPALRKSKEGRRLAQPRWSFWGFGFAYAFVVFAAGMLLILLMAPEIFRGRMETSTALLSAVALGLAMCLATLIFAPSLLFLPAGIAGFEWNLGDAFREASGIRGSLMVLAMSGTLIALVGPLLISLNTLFLPPGFLLLALAFQVLAALLDLFALYLVAYGTARLFIAKTGWQPTPLPEA